MPRTTQLRNATLLGLLERDGARSDVAIVENNGAATNDASELVPYGAVAILREDVGYLLRVCRISAGDMLDGDHIFRDGFAHLGELDIDVSRAANTVVMRSED